MGEKPGQSKKEVQKGEEIQLVQPPGRPMSHELQGPLPHTADRPGPPTSGNLQMEEATEENNTEEMRTER